MAYLQSVEMTNFKGKVSVVYRVKRQGDQQSKGGIETVTGIQNPQKHTSTRTNLNTQASNPKLPKSRHQHQAFAL